MADKRPVSLVIGEDAYSVVELSYNSSKMCCCGEWFHTNKKSTLREKRWDKKHKGHASLCGEAWAKGWRDA